MELISLEYRQHKGSTSPFNLKEETLGFIHDNWGSRNYAISIKTGQFQILKLQPCVLVIIYISCDLVSNITLFVLRYTLMTSSSNEVIMEI